MLLSLTLAPPVVNTDSIIILVRHERDPVRYLEFETLSGVRRASKPVIKLDLRSAKELIKSIRKIT